MTNQKSIGEKLVKLRGNRSQSEVAQAIGTSVSAIGMYESGQRVPRDEIKVRLARYFKTTVEELFFKDDRHVS